MSGTFAGTGLLIRFTSWREFRALRWWLTGVAWLIALQSIASHQTYTTPEQLAALKETAGANPAVLAMAGPTELLATIGGEVTFEIFTTVAILVALMNMFLVGRYTRAEEETGRAELIRSARVGRRAPLGAAIVHAVMSNVFMAVFVVIAASSTGLPAAGSVVLGVATAGVGLFFAGVTAIAVQIFDHTRAVYGAVGVTLGLAFVLRAVGDIGNGMLSWFSPIGWAHRSLPFVENRWWPLLLAPLACVLLVSVAVVLLDRRDFGSGLVPSRPGRETASWALGSALGLAWRLQRGYLFGWTIGLFLLALAFGSFVESIEQFVADNPDLAGFFTGGAADVIDAYLALTCLMLALTASAYGVSAGLRARTEEAAGRAEPILATRTSRARWLASHAAIAIGGTVAATAASGLGVGLTYAASSSDASQIPRLIGTSLVYAPAACAIVAVAMFGFGMLPRVAAPLAWTAVAICVVVTLFQDLVDMPEWLLRVSPFTHTPQVPLQALSVTPLLAIAAVAAVLVAGGFAGLNRRDVGRS